MYVPNKIGTNLTQSLFYKRVIPIQANACILLKEATIKMTQTGFIFRAGRTPVNGRTIANKVGASVRKRKTTGTHHLFRINPLHYIHATPYDERRRFCYKEKKPTIVFTILWIILFSKHIWNNGSIFRAWTTIHSGTFSPLKRKQMKR